MNYDAIDKWGDDLIGWNYGTIHKQYDRDETCEVLEEDTKRAIETLKAIVSQLVTEARIERTEEIRKFIESCQPETQDQSDYQWYLLNSKVLKAKDGR